MLGSGVILGDGGITTALQARGLPLDAHPEWWNLAHPEQVTAVHAAYAAAGAGWSTANTFGANRARLEAFGAADRLADLCAAAVRCAREGAPGLPVLGSIGPAALEREAAPFYEEAVGALAAAGVDGFLAETIVSLEDGRAAVQAAVTTGRTVIASVTPGPDGNLLDGTPLEVAAREWFRLGAWAVGVNCGSGPEALREPVRRLVALREGPVLAAPNAGVPSAAGGRIQYDLTPARFAKAAIQFEELGARLIAGCCGIAPEHLRAASRALRRVQPEE